MGKKLGGSGAFWRDKECASGRATGMEGSARRGAGQYSGPELSLSIGVFYSVQDPVPGLAA